MGYIPVWIKEGYLVYPNGNIWSTKSQKFLQPTVSRDGYLVVSSELGGSIHRILCECFKGGIPKGMVVDHIDGDKQNNNLDNLEIVTYSENSRRAYLLNLAKGMKGEKNPQAKLGEDMAIVVFECLRDGWSNEEIAKLVKLHPRYISLMRHGKRWKHLYRIYGPFENSYTKTTYDDKYLKYLELKDTHRNMDIAEILDVDRSTVSRWRTGETRNK